ncbi:MAG: FtsL-like putative cell division protein [Muribaculum sp.]|nr:FtsL-like putative cell division protein [Muribaculaceae bacterium]MCM1080756.1 FtsL-like putative cell division protein [Muribaculum sp.]
MAKKAKKKADNLLRRTLQGRILSSDFFLNHWKSIILALFMVLIYINNRYQCATRMEQIRRLEQRLEIVETERIRERSQYMSRIRESSMQQMVEKMNLQLAVQDQPPYRIKNNK